MRKTLVVTRCSSLKDRGKVPDGDRTPEIPPGHFRGKEELPDGGFRGDEESLPPGGFRSEEIH